MRQARKLVRCGLAVWLAVLMLASPVAGLAGRGPEAGRVIRVRYSDLDEVILNSNGSYAGYLADYLAEVSRYTGWEYEYIFGTSEETLTRLARGELDLCGMVHRTPEREERFLFSRHSLAEDYAILYAEQERNIYY